MVRLFPVKSMLSVNNSQWNGEGSSHNQHNNGTIFGTTQSEGSYHVDNMGQQEFTPNRFNVKKCYLKFENP